MDIKDVENLANLSRINLGEEEKKDILQDMKGILEYVKVVERPSAEVADDKIFPYNIWREDEIISRDFSRELIIEQFPSKQGDFLKVKKIL